MQGVYFEFPVSLRRFKPVAVAPLSGSMHDDLYVCMLLLN